MSTPPVSKWSGPEPRRIRFRDARNLRFWVRWLQKVQLNFGLALVCFAVDQLHTRVAGPMGRVEEQYFELLQVGG